MTQLDLEADAQSFRSRALAAVLLLLTVALLSACASNDEAPPANPEPVSHWMTEDPAGWPRIALINQIEYTDGMHPSAACGFLVDSGDEILAATAKHVLVYFKSEAMDSVSFAGTLKSWRMFPKDSPDDAVAPSAV